MTTLPFKTTSKFADRGVKAEKAVQKFLDLWEASSPYREYNRLVDTKAAGRIIKSAAADFEFFCRPDPTRHASCHGLLEVKQTEHHYRLAKDKLPQLPRLRKRAKAGGICLVLVLHSETGLWRCLPMKFLLGPSDKGSWDLRELPTFSSPGAALQDVDGIFVEEVFR